MLSSSVDIVIPVYNTPLKLLENCFQSIENQTYEYWRAIVIDDGSDVAVREWLDSWKGTHPKFDVRHVQNSGVSKARNIGIGIAESEYLTFCDADDELDSNFLKVMLKGLRDSNADIAICGTLEETKKGVITHQSNTPKIYVDSFDKVKQLNASMLVGSPYKDLTVVGSSLLGRVYAKVYKSRLLKNKKFLENLSLHEDDLYVYDVYSEVSSVVILNDLLYTMKYSGNSLTHSGNRTKSQIHEERFANELYARYLDVKDDVIRNALRVKLMWTMMYYYFNLAYDQEKNKKLKSMQDSKAFKFANQCCLNDYSPEFIGKKEKMCVKLFKIKPTKLRELVLAVILKVYEIVRAS
jgi:glycosyltransferase involved in cell wall biosynthesis